MLSGFRHRSLDHQETPYILDKPADQPLTLNRTLNPYSWEVWTEKVLRFKRFCLVFFLREDLS